ENDLERATGLARQIVCLYGMNERIGLAHVAQRQNAMLSGPDAPLQRDSSEATAREIDEEVKKLLARSYGEAKAVLEEHRDQLELVTADLLRKETLTGQEFYGLIGLPKPSSGEGKDIGPSGTPA